MNSPDGGEWDQFDGISYYGGYGASISAGQSYLGAFGGGGGSFNISGSLGGFVRTYLPGKQRYGWIWQKGDFSINFSPGNPGWESTNSLSTPITPVSWLNDPIDDIYGEAASRVSMSGTDIISSYPHGYSIAAFEGNSGELRQWNPSGVHNWSRSKNFFAKLSYNFVDGASVTAQSFFRGPNSVHLTGELVRGNDRVDAFVNTASWALFIGEASTFKAINSGVYSSRWGLRIQAHTHPLSPLKGTGATGTMSPFHFNINNTHIIINPKYWKYFY